MEVLLRLVAMVWREVWQGRDTQEENQYHFICFRVFSPSMHQAASLAKLQVEPRYFWIFKGMNPSEDLHHSHKNSLYEIDVCISS